MRDIRTGIKDMFKEEHYNALIYNILDMLDQLDEQDEWVDVRDRLPEQPYDELMGRPALRTKPLLVTIVGDDWLSDKLYGTKDKTYSQVILGYYSFRDNCWKDNNNEDIVRDKGIHSREVIAWKPLPQPFKSKE